MSSVDDNSADKDWVAGMAALRLLLLLLPTLALATPPAECRRYQRDIIREARVVFGIGQAPYALLAGQILQESYCRAGARSAYAQGLMQTTPATAGDLASWYPEIGPADMLNPTWSMRAGFRYDKRLYDAAAGMATEIDRWGRVLMQYNGGPGWWSRDVVLCRQAQQECGPEFYYGVVELHSRRAEWAFEENRHYARVIPFQRQYEFESWGGVVGYDARDPRLGSIEITHAQPAFGNEDWTEAIGRIAGYRSDGACGVALLVSTTGLPWSVGLPWHVCPLGRP